MFGFWGFASRLSTLLAMLMGPLADYLNSLQAAVGLVALFFVIGILLLLPQDLRPEPDAP
jgi:MFS-type transporter involved in bile tolerance (Atg22 family)